MKTSFRPEETPASDCIFDGKRRFRGLDPNVHEVLRPIQRRRAVGGDQDHRLSDEEHFLLGEDRFVRLQWSETPGGGQVRGREDQGDAGTGAGRRHVDFDDPSARRRAPDESHAQFVRACGNVGDELGGARDMADR